MASKYRTLKSLAMQLPVPTLACVEEADFAKLWENYSELRAIADKTLAAIGLTAGAFLDEHLAVLEQLEAPVWRDTAEDFLVDLLDSAGLARDEKLAVRSSSDVEDADSHSFAGLFTTELDVEGLAGIRKALETVWRSSFARAAVLERLRHGLLNDSQPMTVILQRMVAAQWAGVAFSRDPITGDDNVLIEAVEGLGESLVGGEIRGCQARISGGNIIASDFANGHAPPLHDLADLARTVERALNTPVDIEWAYDGVDVWLIQARPITSVATASHDAHPVFALADLYIAGDDAIESFRPLPDFAQYFRSKRKPLADFAECHGVPAGRALLVRANRSGLSEANMERLLARLNQTSVILDFSTRIRQQIVSAGQLPSRLLELVDAKTSTFVVREFIRGDAGIITQPLHRGTLGEWSSDGLLAINRGTGGTRSFVIDVDGLLDTGGGQSGPALPLTAAQLGTLQRTMCAAVEQFGRVQLEWVAEGERLRLIDFSPLRSAAAIDSSDATRTISVGYARGRPVLVEACRDMEELSIAASVSLNSIPAPHELGPLVQYLYETIRSDDTPAIIVSPRPYAALASLVPYAAGFIFEQASTLCHLSILLREHGVPAIESIDLYRRAADADHVAFDTFAS